MRLLHCRSPSSAAVAVDPTLSVKRNRDQAPAAHLWRRGARQLTEFHAHNTTQPPVNALRPEVEEQSVIEHSVEGLVRLRHRLETKRGQDRSEGRELGDHTVYPPQAR